MKYLTLTIPGNNGSGGSVPVNFLAPKNVPSGGVPALDSIIKTGLELAILAGVIVCLFMLIWGGFDWMLSQGDKQKVASARNRLVFSVIGLFVIFLSFMIINIIFGFFFGGPVDFLGSFK
jgi:hypothetical protein